MKTGEMNKNLNKNFNRNLDENPDKSPIMNPRETALRILYDVDSRDAYPNFTIDSYLERSGYGRIDRAFVTELVYGAIKWRKTLDWVISYFSNIPRKKVTSWIWNILRIGCYQILFLDSVPPSAAVNESVKLAKKYGHEASSKYVNGLLRTVVRSGSLEKILEKGKWDDLTERTAVFTSHPEWLVERWVSRYGQEFADELLKANNIVPDLTIRVNTTKIKPEELLGRLNRGEMECLPSRYHPEGLVLRNPEPVRSMPEFAEGLFQVQDESSMFVAKVLDPKPGHLVIDACSAPGGKATHIGEIMKCSGKVIAWDIYPHKVKLVEEAAKRLGLGNVLPSIHDASVPDSQYEGKADRVLVDAPCTGLGIIRRKPDIKWARKPGDIAELAGLQHKILQVSGMYVKPGGFLVYSTCTIEPEENEEQVLRFLRENPDFEPADISGYLPEDIAGCTATVHGVPAMLQLFPHINHTDGFFISKFRRKER